MTKVWKYDRELKDFVKEEKTASQKIAEKAKLFFGDKCKTSKIKLLHQKEVNDFIRKFQDAHRRTRKSNIVFK